MLYMFFQAWVYAGYVTASSQGVSVRSEGEARALSQYNCSQDLDQQCKARNYDRVSNTMHTNPRCTTTKEQITCSVDCSGYCTNNDDNIAQ